MSDMFGGSVPSADFSDYLNQAQDLYRQAQAGVRATPAALQQVGQLKSQLIPQSYSTGLAGSTLLNQSISRGAAEALNQDANQQISQELGLMGNIGQADMAHQVAKAQQGMTPYDFIGQLVGMGLGGFLAGPAGAAIGSQAMGALFR